MYRGLGAFVLSALFGSYVQAVPSDEGLKKLPERHGIRLEEEVAHVVTKVEREVFLSPEIEQEREAYFKRKNYPKAAELLEKAGALRQLDTQLLNFLAFSQYQLGNSDRARELLERPLSLQPDQPQVKELLEKLKSEGGGPGQMGI